MDADDLDQPLFGAQDAPCNDEELTHDGNEWTVLIVDDEQSIHDVTTIALKRFRFHDRPLRFLHAYSSAEAEQVMASEPEVAVVLLDVVMETDDSGLRLVKIIRERQKNHKVRIILRTGQPGQAPESHVIEHYDINDYKEKTDLTAQRLTTTMFASLRSYRDLLIIDQHRLGLERVIASTASIFQYREMDDFLSGLLLQLVSVLNQDADAFYTASSGFVSGYCPPEDERSTIISGTGRFESLRGQSPEEGLEPLILEHLAHSRRERRTVFLDLACVFYFENSEGGYGQVYLSGCAQVDEPRRRLVELFGANTAIAFENISLNREIEETQHEIVNMLGTVAEFRSKETGDHVERVAEYSELLALLHGLDQAEAKLIRLASPLHDIGKIGIPDAVLQKPGPFTSQDMEIMREHPNMGYQMLKGSKRAILSSAAVIARDHQEKWDGSGYPERRSGEDIHLYGRIVAVADVFDALVSTRCYKKAWTIPEVLEYFQQQRGKHFDPELTDLLLEHLDRFVAIRDRHHCPNQDG